MAQEYRQGLDRLFEALADASLHRDLGTIIEWAASKGEKQNRHPRVANVGLDGCGGGI